MYLEYYGLERLPFQITPDVRFFFDSHGHRRARSTIVYGLSKNEGFVVITGAIGAGKTSLIEHLLASGRLADSMVARINTTQLESESLLELIAYALQLPRVADTKAGILRDLEAFLQQSARSGKRVLLIVDEVQNLSREALEELRMLSNFQDRENPLLQMLLVGQPEFRQRLAGPDCEQIRQRVIASYHLSPLAPADVPAYVEHRLHLGGWDGRRIFTAGALDRIAAESDGLPRRINRLCDRLLLYGYLEECPTLDADAVAAVVADMRAESLEGGDIDPAAVSAVAAPAYDSAAGAGQRNDASPANGADQASQPGYYELLATVSELRKELAAYKLKITRIMHVLDRKRSQCHRDADQG